MRCSNPRDQIFSRGSLFFPKDFFIRLFWISRSFFSVFGGGSYDGGRSNGLQMLLYFAILVSMRLPVPVGVSSSRPHVKGLVSPTMQSLC